jgi:hypothetical protein
MGFAILLGDGTLCRERNVFLPTRLYLELYRHAVDRLPLTVPHRDHEFGGCMLCDQTRSLQR